MQHKLIKVTGTISSDKIRHVIVFYFSWETDDEGDFYSEQTNDRTSDQDDEDNLFRLGLSRNLIECYPMSTAEELAIVGVVCDICLNEYKTHDKIRTIPCLHKFHTRCIDKWLKVRDDCLV